MAQVQHKEQFVVERGFTNRPDDQRHAGNTEKHCRSVVGGVQRRVRNVGVQGYNICAAVAYCFFGTTAYLVGIPSGFHRGHTLYRGNNMLASRERSKYALNVAYMQLCLARVRVLEGAFEGVMTSLRDFVNSPPS